MQKKRFCKPVESNCPPRACICNLIRVPRGRVLALAVGNAFDLCRVGVALVKPDFLVAESSVPKAFDGVTRNGRGGDPLV